MIFPAITETLVLPLDADEVEKRVGEGIESKKFNGTVANRSFSLWAHLVRPPQFSPITRGRIEGSSRGSLIFLRYELMPATKLLLGFVSVLLIALAGVGWYLGANPWNAPFAIALVFVFRSVALTNIRIHKTPVRQNLLDILS